MEGLKNKFKGGGVFHHGGLYHCHSSLTGRVKSISLSAAL